MANLKLKNPAGGSLNLVSADGASDLTVTFPAGTGTAVVNGVSSAIVSGTVVASTSGTSIDFTGIPSWVKRITVMFSGVSTNGTSGFKIQIGTGGSPTTSGYSCSTSVIGTGVATASDATGFNVVQSGQWQAAGTMQGLSTVCLLDPSTNTWAFNSTVATTGLIYTSMSGGFLALSGTLNMIRVTTTTGTDTFDAGSINILYE